MTEGNTSRTRRLLTRFARDRKGATAIEYALIAVGISVAIAVTVFGVGTALEVNFYQKVRDSFASAPAP